MRWRDLAIGALATLVLWQLLAWAIDRPMPLAAPVTKAVRSISFMARLREGRPL